VTHAYPQYLDADGSICLGKIMALAQARARHDRARTGSAKPLRQALSDALRHVWQNAQSAHRIVVVTPAWRAAQDPVALEIASHELRIEIIQDTMRGASPYAKRTYRQRIAAHERRIAELRALRVIAAEAALSCTPTGYTVSDFKLAAGRLDPVCAATVE
jgi:hypothetical protein